MTVLFDYSRHYGGTSSAVRTPQQTAATRNRRRDSPKRSMAFGDVYTCFVAFEGQKTGKVRPVMVYGPSDEDPKKVQVFKITSQTDKPFSRQYGYQIRDLAACRLKKKSAVILHPENLYTVRPSDLHKRVGTLSKSDQLGSLTRWIRNEDRLMQRTREKAESLQKDGGPEL